MVDIVGISTKLLYGGKFSKVQNFGIKLKCVPKNILEELNFEASTYKLHLNLHHITSRAA